jgi:hypothetical protein
MNVRLYLMAVSERECLLLSTEVNDKEILGDVDDALVPDHRALASNACDDCKSFKKDALTVRTTVPGRFRRCDLGSIIADFTIDPSVGSRESRLTTQIPGLHYLFANVSSDKEDYRARSFCSSSVKNQFCFYIVGQLSLQKHL